MATPAQILRTGDGDTLSHEAAIRGRASQNIAQVRYKNFD